MTNIVGAGGSDPLWASVRFLYQLTSNLSDEGPNSFADATANGTGALVAQDGIPGGKAYYNNQTVNDANKLVFPNEAIPDEGAGDWTFEFQVYDDDWIFAALQDAQTAFFADNDLDSSSMLFDVESNGEQTGYDFLIRIRGSTGGSFLSTNTYPFTEGANKHHLAACRNGSNFYFYIDGVLKATFAIGSIEFNFNSPIGVYSLFGKNSISDSVASAYINNVRWTSAARYDGTNFTPPETNFFNPTAAAASEKRRVRAWPMRLDGHNFYILRLGEQATMVYDLATKQWSEFITEGFTTWNAELGVSWNGFTTVADNTDGKLYIVDPAATLDQGNLDITRIVTGGFPLTSRAAVSCNAVRVASSVGAPTAVAPTMSLRWSDDNGRTFSAPRALTLVTGDFDQTLEWRALGSMRTPGRVFEFTDVGGVIRIDYAEIETDLPDG